MRTANPPAGATVTAVQSTLRIPSTVWPTSIAPEERETTIVVRTTEGVVGPESLPPPHAANRMFSTAIVRNDRASGFIEIGRVMAPHLSSGNLRSTSVNGASLGCVRFKGTAPVLRNYGIRRGVLAPNPATSPRLAGDIPHSPTTDRRTQGGWQSDCEPCRSSVLARRAWCCSFAIRSLFAPTVRAKLRYEIRYRANGHSTT